MADVIESILNSQHPYYKKWLPIWKRNETRLAGGDAVIDEALKPFNWEKLAAAEAKPSTHFDERKDMAVWINFPARVAYTMVGSIRRKAPKPDKGIVFGKLGKAEDKKSRAHWLFNSVDKTDGTGQDLTSFFDGAQRRSMATGHRWIHAESYVKPATITGDTVTEAQEKEYNLRPYLVEYSPIVVPNWYFDNNGLAWFLIKTDVITPTVTSSGLEMKAKPEYYLHVRKGYTTLDVLKKVTGILPSAGGYFTFNSDFKLVKERSGEYKNTKGQIPTGVFYYEESDGTPDFPAISRPGLSEVSRLAGSYLNLSSAGDNDAIEGGSRLLFLLGTDKKQHNEVSEQLLYGGRVVSVPKSDPEGDNPELVDIARTSAHAAVEARLTRRLQEMETLASDETKLAPGASGVARDTQFKDTKSPRLAMMAKNRARIETTMLRFIEQRWLGVEPTAMSSWPTDYDLKPVLESIRDVLGIVVDAGAVSPSLVGTLVSRALEELGLTNEFSEDDLVKKIISEIETSLAAQVQGFDSLTAPVPPVEAE